GPRPAVRGQGHRLEVGRAQSSPHAGDAREDERGQARQETDAPEVRSVEEAPRTLFRARHPLMSGARWIPRESHGEKLTVVTAKSEQRRQGCATETLAAKARPHE